ncbi:MAG: VWA domain-containing protein [Saonia sp.]
MSEMNSTYRTSLSANVVLLSRFLRKKGFALSATEEADALYAISLLPIHNEDYFREALRAVLSKNELQRSNFNAYYREFKEQLAKSVDSKIKNRPTTNNDQKSPARQQQERFESLKNWLNLSPSDEEKGVASYSNIEVLTKKDFHDLSEEEMRLMMRLLQKMARRLAHQKSRLKKVAKKRRNLDLRHTVRTNMRKGGDIQRLVFTEKKERKLKLVLLCDVSRSMELYSRFFIHLIYAFQNAYDKIETFVFSTALYRVSEILDQQEFDKAFATISDRVPHWSGGTTIGSCLNHFTQEYGYRMLDKKTIVILLSDGWDTGNPEQMKDAMKTIYKKSKQVIWLNPLAGSANFSPEAIGMKTALPYIDVLASAHNLESLRLAMLHLRKRRNLSNQQEK